MSEHDGIRHPVLHLQSDCENCFGLCCVALPYAASADFAADKDAGQPCANLQSDFRCGIHTGLRERGYRGCTVYECFGAGQHVSQVTFGGRDWRQHPGTAKQMFDVFPIVRQLHELLLYLSEALTLPAASALSEELKLALDETRQLTLGEPAAIIAADVPALRLKVSGLLLQSSELARGEARRRLRVNAARPKKSGRKLDYIGANLQRADLRCANLRGAYMIAANLRQADLRAADLTGADLRDADLSGADLTGSLFLTQSQLNSAKGDAGTKLPPHLEHPGHWPVSSNRNVTQ